MKLILVIVAAILLMPNIASAHAVLVSSTPKDSSTIKASPAKIVLRFDAKIDKQVSKVTLFDSKGRKVNLKAPAGGYKQGASNELVIPVPKLTPGNYRLQYQVMATDGHLTPGQIKFTISGGKST